MGTLLRAKCNTFASRELKKNKAMNKMKLFCVALVGMTTIACSQQQVSPDTPYIIEGELTGLRDSLVISLFQYDGNVGTRIASDTVINGRFRFEQVMHEPELNRLGLICRDADFPSMSCDIYVAPGTQIKVKGHNAHIHTWDVQSNVPEQKESNLLLQAASAEYEDYQDVSVAYNQIIKELNAIDRKADKEHYAEAYRRYKKIDEQGDSIQQIITRKQVEVMRNMKPSQPWMKKLEGMAVMAGAYNDYAFRNETIELFESLSDEVKQSMKGIEIHSQLYPPQKVSDGDECPDADLYDLQGNLHHLSEHRGKYV